MTDLEKHVSQPGRDKLVKQVRAKINELGVEYIFFQFISVTGRVVGKGIPTDHWERTCEKGFQLVYGATANLFVDRHKNYIGYGPEAKELVGIPDPETFCQFPWDKKCLEFYKRKDLISKTASNIQIRQAIYKHSVDKYLPYKKFLGNYRNKYQWFN